MANGAVMGMVLKDIPGVLPEMDSCPSCTLAKVQHPLFKTGCTCAMAPLELIHGDLGQWNPLAIASTDLC